MLLQDLAFDFYAKRMILMPKQLNGRLTQPMIRANGVLRPASWDEALDRTAAGFRAVLEQHGPQAFGIFSCSKTTNELNFVAQKFARAVMGSNNVDSCNRT
jgi:predicted molibdopterin-dependent oxidoreductase YjgC